MAAPPTPVELPEALLLDEIIYRLPPQNPASLFRASAVSRAWRAFVTNGDFIRSYRQLHKAPPILGLLENYSPDEEEEYRFIATANPTPPIKVPIIASLFGDMVNFVIDCRHGRVVILNLDDLDLYVCNLITGKRLVLRILDFAHRVTSFSAAVLCAKDGCDHLDCDGGPYRLVFTATSESDGDAGLDYTWACLYSSATNSWTEVSTVHLGPLKNTYYLSPSLLVGDAVYFTLDLWNNRTVLRYDLGTAALSEIAPPLALARRDMFLVTGKGGGLGVAAVENYRIRVWSLHQGVWVLWREIDLEALITPTIGVPTTLKVKVIGFAEMSGVMFLRADDDGNVSTVELSSGKVSEIGVQLYSSDTIFPFESFYTPAIRNA